MDRKQWLGILWSGMAALALAGVIPVEVSAQQPVAASLAFEGVTVVDVEQGKLIRDQRVLITGNRIAAIGSAGVVPMPTGAQVVDARGKYLIPGLWDMHTHSDTMVEVFYPLFVANGITGIRDAASSVPLDVLVRWQQEILAGTRVGPPRQLLAGPAFSMFGLGSAFSIHGPDNYVDEPLDTGTRVDPSRFEEAMPAGSADVAYFADEIDSLKAQGANFIKMVPFTFTLAAAARRVGLPFGGHVPRRIPITASDSGVKIFDHTRSGSLDQYCAGPKATVADCQFIARRFEQNGSWWAPTLVLTPYCCVKGQGNVQQGAHVLRIGAYLEQRSNDFWAGTLPPSNWLHAADSAAWARPEGGPSAPGYLSVAQRVGFPMLTGTDVMNSLVRKLAPGFALHAEMAMFVAEGMSPAAALRAATLNPAALLQGTDSLGTVAVGKLADLVLLDANPLEDITNTTTIRAVVANGRYFDRAALDRLLAEARAKVTGQP